MSDDSEVITTGPDGTPLIPVTKDGVVLYVHPLCVSAHVWEQWKLVQ